MSKLVTESELKDRIYEIYQEEFHNILNEKWNKLTGSERRFIIEFVKEFYPNKAHLINEAKWYNTLGDIVGIFDPTGLVDVINSISYFKQGDTLFGAMSLISAVPYIGDVVGKPIVLGLKSGGAMAKQIRLAKTATQWGRLGEKYPIIGKLISTVENWGDKILRIIERVPGGKRFTSVLKQWIEMIKGATIKRTIRRTSGASKLVDKEIRMFRDFGVKDLTGFKKFWKKGGFFGKNRQLSRLLVKTKFWLGFLDYLGVANFVGPDELISQMGENTLNANMDEYMKTPEATKNWDSEMVSLQSMDTPPPPPQTSPTSPVKGGDILSTIIGGLLGGSSKLV